MKKMNFFILSFAVFLALCLSSLPPSLARSQNSSASQDPLKLKLDSPNFGSLQSGTTPSANTSDYLILVADRTKRPDILRSFKPYVGGWNLTNTHYWTSLGFTGVPGFILAALWIVLFGTFLVAYLCCNWQVFDKANASPYSLPMICLILLTIFTLTAVVGCILLYVGGEKFHTETLHTLKYVINQSDYTVETLQNVTQYLSLAKTINVTSFSLPTNIMDEIDKLDVELNTAEETVEEITTHSAAKIKRDLHVVRVVLITVPTVVLILCSLGLLVSFLRCQTIVHILVVFMWIMVAGTFILFGLSLILNNLISDACLSMKQWIDHPHAETALSSILPCVDQQTTNHTLVKNKAVINQIVKMVNTFVYAYANTNPAPGQFGYYNQSGPPMPPLCMPFDSNMEERQCSPQELSIENASSVWEKYICEVSESGICRTVGRVTPDNYVQLVTAVKESYALEHYTPPLLSFRDCEFVRDTFKRITSDYCPILERNLRIISAGVGVIAAGVLLCVVLWILYSKRPQRVEEVLADQEPQAGDESKLAVEMVKTLARVY